jgi:hypothetical protein
MAMEARRTGGAESGQDRVLQEVEWCGDLVGGDEDDGNESGRPR